MSHSKKKKKKKPCVKLSPEIVYPLVSKTAVIHPKRFPSPQFALCCLGLRLWVLAEGRHSHLKREEMRKSIMLTETERRRGRETLTF